MEVASLKSIAFALLCVGDRHIDRLGRYDLGEPQRTRWGVVGRPNIDGARSNRVPDVSVGVAVYCEALSAVVLGYVLVLDGAGGRPGHVHEHRERIARHSVGDGNGRTQACRQEILIDLESRVIRPSGCIHYGCVRA